MLLAIGRIKANLIGALIGLAASYFHPVNLPIICANIAIAMVICEWLNLKAITKSYVVAILVITMHEQGHNFSDIALERAGGVKLGCIIGVILTYIFHIAQIHSSRTLHKFRRKR